MQQLVTIIGTGPAGLTAAIYTARAALKPVVFAGLQHGGQLITTTEVENFPGFENPILGPALMEEMTKQAQRLGVEIVHEEITKVDFSTEPLTLWAGDQQFTSTTAIIAVGATARTLGLPSEAELMGRGLSTCATCDGFFYRDKQVMVVGGGDSAMEESLYLSKICRSVILVHRRDQFRASPIMLARARKNDKIQFFTPYQVVALQSDRRGLTGVKVEHQVSHKTQTIAIDGLFMAIGHTPNSAVFAPYVDTDEHGYIKVTDYTRTNIAAVFAAGDISDPHFKQAVTAAGMGCQAALQAQRHIEALA